jgi:hypothetical protein
MSFLSILLFSASILLLLLILPLFLSPLLFMLKETEFSSIHYGILAGLVNIEIYLFRIELIYCYI